MLTRNHCSDTYDEESIVGRLSHQLVRFIPVDAVQVVTSEIRNEFRRRNRGEYLSDHLRVSCVEIIVSAWQWRIQIYQESKSEMGLRGHFLKESNVNFQGEFEV